MSITKEELVALVSELKREGYNVSRIESRLDLDLYSLLEDFNAFMDDVNSLIELRKEFLSLDLRGRDVPEGLITEIKAMLWDPDAVPHLRAKLAELKAHIMGGSKREHWIKEHSAVQDELKKLAQSRIGGGDGVGEEAPAASMGAMAEPQGCEGDKASEGSMAASEGQGESGGAGSGGKKYGVGYEEGRGEENGKMAESGAEESDIAEDHVPEGIALKDTVDDAEARDGAEDVKVVGNHEAGGNMEGVSEGNKGTEEGEKTGGDKGGSACKACKGTGMCYSCQGKGTCFWCNGTGKIVKDGAETKCPYCSGTGKCYWCNGTGKCSKCGGTGLA